MLQCDACRDWFHWDCVGLTPPGDDEDDEEVAPADFQCPSCCIKVCISGAPCSANPEVISPMLRRPCKAFISPGLISHALRSPGGRVLAAPAASTHEKGARGLCDLRALVERVAG